MVLKEKSNLFNSLNNLRVFSLVQVFLLHYFAGTGKLDNLWIFSLAVPTFLLISAYLYGLRDSSKITFGIPFLKKRWLSVSKTYYLFILSVFCFYALYDFDNINIYLISLIGGLSYLNNFFPHLPSCGHLWFMQVLMMCYVVLAFVGPNKLVKKWFVNRYKSIILFLFVILCGLFYRGYYLVYLFFYIWVFYNAKRLNEVFKRLNGYTFWLIFIVGYALLALKYSSVFKLGMYITYIHTSVLSILLICCFMKYKTFASENSIVFFIGTISMEIYLIHHLFVFDNPWYISALITIILSFILHKIVQKLRFVKLIN